MTFMLQSVSGSTSSTFARPTAFSARCALYRPRDVCAGCLYLQGRDIWEAIVTIREPSADLENPTPISVLETQALGSQVCLGDFVHITNCSWRGTVAQLVPNKMEHGACHLHKRARCHMAAARHALACSRHNPMSCHGKMRVWSTFALKS